jgi:exopolysaccharide biosynthesis polyprenyl glycosylphosphotransferase
MKVEGSQMGDLREPIVGQRARPAISRSLQTDQWRIITVVLVILDSGMIFLAFRFAYWLRFSASLPFFQLDVVPSPEMYMWLTLGMLPIWVAIFAIGGLYNRQNLFHGKIETALLMNASTASVFLVMVTDFLETNLVMARGWLLIAWVATFISTSIGRFAVRRVVQVLRRKGLLLSPAIIVGTNEEARLLAEQFSNQEFSGLSIVGFIDGALPPNTLVYRNLKTIGNLEHIDQIVQDHEVSEVILAASSVDQAGLMTLFQKFGFSDSVNLRMSSGLYEIIATGFQVTEFSNVPLVGINKVRLTGINQAAKLLLDYSLAIPLLVVLIPVLAVIALLVKLDSPGPIIYRRRVMGVGGSQFDAYKFRTMVTNGDEILKSHPELMEEYQKNIKLKSDPRVTRLGGFLRKASLDELPQIFNVLKNEMSLVGPRMICPEEMALYQQAGINLLTVKPGITGLWQVSGRSDTSYEARVQMDMYYIRNWSIWMDLQILLRTIPSVLFGKGAY